MKVISALLCPCAGGHRRSFASAAYIENKAVISSHTSLGRRYGVVSAGGGSVQARACCNSGSRGFEAPRQLAPAEHDVGSERTGRQL